MNVRSVVLIASLSFAFVGAASADVVLPEAALPGLQPILQQAVQQSPRMIQRAVDLEIAENSRITARSGLLPFIGANYSYYEARDDRADLPDTVDVSKVYYNASITQPVFHWGERRNNARIGEISKSIAEGNYKLAYRALAQELRQKYLQLIVQKVSVARTREYLSHAQAQARLAEERLQKRVISDAELYPIQLAAEQGQIAFDRAEYDFQFLKHSFARLAGLNEIQDSQIPDEIPAINYGNESYAQKLGQYLSLQEMPSMEAVNMRQQMRIEDLNYKNHRVRLLPKINFIVGASQDEQSYTVNVSSKYRVNSLYAGFGVNWTIFDGFATQAAKRTSLARRRQMQAEYEDLVDRLSQQAQQQSKYISFAARNMAITDRALTSGEGLVKNRREEFQRGSVAETDVKLAEIAYYDARINAYNARMDFLLKSGDFLGTLNEDPAVSNLNVAR
jgi:outer membrane protein TolC